MDARQLAVRVVPMVGFAVLVPLSAVQGYGGPGSVVTGIGAFLAAVAAVGAALVGFVWFPLKRLIRAFRSEPDEAVEEG